jgi:hypothetical protein
MSTRKEYAIIKPVGLKPKPDEYEENVAELVALHFKSDIKFVKRETTTTPDLLVLRYNQRWEIKNVKGNSKHTIQNNLREAGHQSDHIFVSLLRTKMTEKQAISRINFFLKNDPNTIKHIILITKSGKTIVIK